MSASHPQVWTKVNAPVDAGVASLVFELSKVEGLETVESCQGEPDKAAAFVLFRFGGWRECAWLIFEGILPAIPEKLRTEVSLSMRAYDQNNALASISVDARAIADVTECIRRASTSICLRITMARDAHGQAIPKVIPAA